MTDNHELSQSVANCEADQVMALVQAKLDAGVDAAEILAECNRGMIELGDRFEKGVCFIPDLMFGGMIMKNVTEVLGPLLRPGSEGEKAGKVVIGTVQHDVHDIGKDIVAMMLRGVGFDVVDLGVDVPPDRFVAAVQEHRPDVLALSVLLTTCFKSVVATVEALKNAAVREGLTIMVGGAAASDLVAQRAGCDYYGKTAIDGVRHASQLVGLK
jgi:methylmalonyl-CoA mutase cobalamin-binding domain/chain